MSPGAEIVVVGAGLAGACAALVLSRTHEVLVIEAEGPARGASGAAAGMVNPFMGRKAKAAWRHAEALDALTALAEEAGPDLYQRTGVVRPATTALQAATFRDRASLHGELRWHLPEASGERWPAVASPHGTLEVASGGSVDIAAFVRAALEVVVQRGGRVMDATLTGWHGTAPLHAITDRDTVQASTLVLALGDGARSLPALATLPLHRVKGQTIRLDRPATLLADHPAIAGAGYVVPRADGVLVGATFEHTFTDLAPDPARDAGLVERASALVPALAQAEVIERQAGVRLTVPAVVSPRRLPLAGPLPGHPGVWVVTGLGAKGLLTAPLIAERLADALTGRRPLPADLWPAPIV